MTTPRAILLDAGGVLLLPEHGRIRTALTRVGLGDTPADLDRVHHLAMAAYDRVELAAGGAGTDGAGFEAYLATYAAAIAPRADPPDRDAVSEALREAFDDPQLWSRPMPGVVEALASLVATGVAVAIVSNTERGNAAELLLRAAICEAAGAAEDGPADDGPATGVTPVAAIVDSAVVGVRKPDPAIFGLALEAVGAEPSAALHAGDSVFADVGGAHAAGLAARHVDPFGVCALPGHAHIASLGDLVPLVIDRDP